MNNVIHEEIKKYLISRKLEVPNRGPMLKCPNPNNEVHGMKVRFNPECVDHALRVISALRHTKGRWAGKPLKLTNVQIAYIVAPLFGWQVYDDSLGRWLRLYRDAYIEMPRKGAKSTLASALAMVLAFGDHEGGAEVIIGAASRDQAGACFTPLKQLVDNSPLLKQAGIRSLHNSIKQDRTSSVIKVVSSKGDLAHGANLHGAICDELHVHKSLSLLEAMETGTGAREQPLTMVITTADDGSVGTPYDQRRELVDNICKGVVEAPRSFAVVWSASPEDDPWSEETWAKANPLYPVTPSRAFMQSAADKARTDPVAKASFLRLHLGIRGRLDESWISRADWMRGAVDQLDVEGRQCYGGLDLAAVSDLTALVWLFPAEDGTYQILPRFFLPEAALVELDRATYRNASVWASRGLIKLTPGNVTDYDFVKAQIDEDAKHYDIQCIGFDPWNATQVSNDLQADGYRLEKVRQGFVSMSGPMKEIQRLVMQGGAIKHDGNPLMAWQIDNIRPAMDPAGNIKPAKQKKRDKIDGVAALVTAMNVWQFHKTKVSAYGVSGLESI